MYSGELMIQAGLDGGLVLWGACYEFEAATPQTLSFELDFDLTDPNPTGAAQIHAADRYTMTIQRVRDDGSPL